MKNQLLENADYGYYHCDAGSLLIGNKDFRVHIHNGYGDGRFQVIISNDSKLLTGYIDYGYHYVTDIVGKGINVYPYDCLNEEELKKSIPISILNGRYSAFNNYGDILLVKHWEKEEE